MESGSGSGTLHWQHLALNVFAALVLVMMAAICLQVVCSLLDVNPVAVFQHDLFLFGTAVTLNSLLDFQWHILVVVGLLPAGIVWLRDGHVRVDFLYSKWSARRRAIVELVGHVTLSAPFIVLATPAAWAFTLSAWSSGQGSSNSGLNDLWLIKGTLPLGLALLGVVLVIDSVRQARYLAGRG